MSWQPVPVVYPDVELELTRALRVALFAPDVYVGREVPNPRRRRMVIVTRDGGTAANFRDVARVRVRVWDQTTQAAIDLARLVVTRMPLIVDGSTFTAVEQQSGPFEVADDSKQPQQYLLFDVHTRGTST